MKGCVIEWTSEQSNLTRRQLEEKKPKGKKGKGKEVRCAAWLGKAHHSFGQAGKTSKAVSSFFHFFSTPESRSPHFESQQQMAIALMQEVVPNMMPLCLEPCESVDDLLSEDDLDPPVDERWRQPEVRERLHSLWELHQQATLKVDRWSHSL